MPHRVDSSRRGAQVNLLKKVRTSQGWRLCPVVRETNGRLRDRVRVGGRIEVHAEGVYYLEWREDGRRRREAIPNPAEVLERARLTFPTSKECLRCGIECCWGIRSELPNWPALPEKIFEMGRYWFILTSGKYPSISPEINSTINLQTAGAVQGNLREAMEAYFNWMESLTSDCRVNARNIFGFRGTSYPLFPDKGIGVSFYYTSSTEIGAGLTGSPQEAGVCARSGTITWLLATWSFCAIACSPHTESWRCFTILIAVIPTVWY